MNGIIFLVVLGLGYIMYLSYGKKLLAEGRKGHIKIAVIVIGLVILLAVATGRANVLLAPLGAAMALITRFGRFAPTLFRYFPQLRNIFGNFAQPMSGAANSGAGSANRGRSRVQTNTLVMLFDHATGDMNGTVKRGQFEGYQLSDLSVGELRNLHQYCSSADPEAMRLLNVYLARYHSQHFGGAGAGGAGDAATDTSSAMDDKEAYDILGLAPGATREQISQAHRSLIGKMHPDKGGSTYLATKINAARDQLLK